MSSHICGDYEMCSCVCVTLIFSDGVPIDYSTVIGDWGLTKNVFAAHSAEVKQLQGLHEA